MRRLALLTLLLVTVSFGMTSSGQEIVPRDQDAPPVIRQSEEGGRPVIEVQIPERRLPIRGVTSAAVAEVERDLSGRWLLTLPAGWQQKATIERLEDGRYRLPGHGNLNGIYVLEGRTLTLVEHEDDPMPNFVWEVLNDNTLRLRIDENHAGATYLGATLGRQIDWDEFEDNSRTTPALVRPALIARPALLLARPAAPQEVTLTGKAYNDETQPPYLETEDDIIFLRGFDAWPEDAVEKTVTITGMLTNEQIADGDSTLPARFVQIQSYSVEGGPQVTIEPATPPSDTPTP
jgi:hypothetical protein